MTPRQRQLLQAIIDEFIETAEAVGSLSLYDKYKLRVSLATIRNEMATLVREGYLDQLHSSSGRRPTTLGLRYFVEELMNEYNSPDIVTQEQAKMRMHASRFSKEELVREALKFLVGYTHNAAVALVDKEVYYYGLSEMLNIPEMKQIDNLKVLLGILEDYATLSKIFHQSRREKLKIEGISEEELEQEAKNVRVLIGEEAGLDTFEPYAIVFTELRLHGGKSGYIAVIGPNRMDYRSVIPVVDFVGQTINRMASGW